MADELVPRAELVAMEDERDAAILDVERLQQIVDNGQKMIDDLRSERDALLDVCGDAKLDAEGYRREVAAFAERVNRLSALANGSRTDLHVAQVRHGHELAASQAQVRDLADLLDQARTERDEARATIARVRAQCEMWTDFGRSQAGGPFGEVARIAMGTAGAIVFGLLDSVAAGGGVAPVETPAATDTRPGAGAPYVVGDQVLGQWPS